MDITELKDEAERNPIVQRCHKADFSKVQCIKLLCQHIDWLNNELMKQDLITPKKIVIGEDQYIYRVPSEFIPPLPNYTNLNELLCKQESEADDE